LDEKNRQLLYFIDSGWEHGREGAGNATEILVSGKTNVNFELLQNWVN
jgi:hypothetical protein